MTWLLPLLVCFASTRALKVKPNDSDSEGWHNLGKTLTSQDRADEAISAFKTALAADPGHVESMKSLAAEYGKLGDYQAEKDYYQAAIKLKPQDVSTHLALGVCHTSLDENAEAELAFRTAAEVGPTDARPALNLGRYLTQLSRPAEAVTSFYAAAGIDVEYFPMVKSGVGTARAQQGRLVEALASFESALRMDPDDPKLKAAVPAMAASVASLNEVLSTTTNAVADVCGTPCQELVDTHSMSMCEVTWEQGCGDEPPPDGVSPQATVAQLCAHACAAAGLVKRAPTADGAAAKVAPLQAAAKERLRGTETERALRDATAEKNWTRGYVETAASNVVLDCAKRDRPLADGPKLASQEPAYAAARARCPWGGVGAGLWRRACCWSTDACEWLFGQVHVGRLRGVSRRFGSRLDRRPRDKATAGARRSGGAHCVRLHWREPRGDAPSAPRCAPPPRGWQPPPCLVCLHASFASTPLLPPRCPLVCVRYPPSSHVCTRVRARDAITLGVI